jgi:hypothetical protein
MYSSSSSSSSSEEEKIEDEDEIAATFILFMEEEELKVFFLEREIMRGATVARAGAGVGAGCITTSR